MDEEPLTVKQLADRLGEVPSKVHYHVKELERIGVLGIVDKKKKQALLKNTIFQLQKDSE